MNVRDIAHPNKAGRKLLSLALGLVVWTASASFAFATEHVVSITSVTDLKAVFARVESVDVAFARTRIGGTITRLNVDEGVQVKKGQTLALVNDPKLKLQLAAIGARKKALLARMTLASSDLARARKLRKSGTLSQASLDQATALHEIVVSEIAAVDAETAVLAQRRAEGAVLAPTLGRVLKVNVTEGTVVMPGEAIAEIAAERFILRLRLPERHARFMQQGDKALVGGRGVAAFDPKVREGRVRQVYPKLEAGQVVADVTVEGLGDFFVGERIRVWVPAGKRNAIVIPETYVYNRFGVSFVRLDDGVEVAVQVGAKQANGLEILSGLRAGDRLVSQ